MTVRVGERRKQTKVKARVVKEKCYLIGQVLKRKLIGRGRASWTETKEKEKQKKDRHNAFDGRDPLAYKSYKRRVRGDGGKNSGEWTVLSIDIRPLKSSSDLGHRPTHSKGLASRTSEGEISKIQLIYGVPFAWTNAVAALWGWQDNNDLYCTVWTRLFMHGCDCLSICPYLC